MTELWANYFVVLSVFLFVVYVMIINTNEESTIKLNKVAQIDSFLFIYVWKFVGCCIGVWLKDLSNGLTKNLKNVSS